MAAAVAFAAAAGPVFAQPRTPFQVLDVPYVPQSEELCGGAAAAMVMRYWGATGIYAESFSELVDRAAGGIRGEDLIRGLQARGWQAASLGGDAALLQRSLRDRRPPIALIEDRPGRFHYVVVVSWFAGTVIVHDPARAPFRILTEQEFMLAWSRADAWTLVVLPPRPNEGSDSPAPPPPVDVPAATPGVCGTMVDEAVRLANGGAVQEAGRLLELAVARCPIEVAPWRESAGIHVLRQNWAGAATHARRALQIDPRDDHAARTLATSLYLAGDAPGALAAWNLVGEPAIDLIDVRGLERTRYSVAAAAMGLHPQTPLTPQKLNRGARRLDAVPALIGSRISYTPADDGLARVSAAVIERPVLPTTLLALGATAVRAATDREIRLDVASATGGGELLHAAWRWWAARPRVSVGLDAPLPFGGILAISAVDERETFGLDSALFVERRRSASLSVRDWASGSIEWELSLTGERWPAGSAAGLFASIRYQAPGDRLSIRARGGGWAAPSAPWSSGASIDWRSVARHEGTVWLARAAADAVARSAPLATWSGAGTGQGRAELLRAHPLLDDGVIRDGVFGRALASGGGEWRRWGRPVFRVLRLAPAVFIDAARAFGAPPFADARAHVDVGAGLRVAIPGAGVLRADAARGLRDGQMALSFGWATNR